MKLRSFVLVYDISYTDASLVAVHVAWERLWKAAGGGGLVDVNNYDRTITFTLDGDGATPELMELFFKELQR
jgi:hypothetical protein